MKFVVNDVAAIQGGVYTILSDFYMDVLKNDHENQWIFILAHKFFPESENVKIITRDDLKRSKVKKVIFELFTGRKFINAFSPDVYISLQNIATFGIKAKYKIVYLHQPVPFIKNKKFNFFKKNERQLAFYQKIVGLIIKKSLHFVKPKVIVQTRWMKRAVIEQCKLRSDYISVVHPQVIQDNKTKYNGDGKEFFYPSSNYIYKNHQVIYKAIKLLNQKGIKDFCVKFTLSEDQLNYKENNIQYLGFLPRKEVMKMYNDNVLLFPSYMESFGLPLIEAALTADIILAADTEFSRELLSTYKNVYFFKYNDYERLAELMEKVIMGEIKSNGDKIHVQKNTRSVFCTISSLIN